MTQSVVAVIDSAKARFFTLEPAELPEIQSGPNLIERDCLTNTAKDLAGKDLWTDVKSGRNRSVGAQGHGYDDHRESHMDRFDRSFAKDIATKITEFSHTYHTQQILLVAEPQILGFVREALLPHLPKQFKLKELAKDLCKLKPLELHEYLATKELLPARKIVNR